MIEVKMYDNKTGELIATYNSVGEAALETGISKSSISANLRGRVKTVRKKQFYFRSDQVEYKPVEKPKKRESKNKKAIDLYDYKTDEFIRTYSSLTEAAEDLGLRPANISQNLKGETKSLKKKQYYFKYHNGRKTLL